MLHARVQRARVITKFGREYAGFYPERRYKRVTPRVPRYPERRYEFREFYPSRRPRVVPDRVANNTASRHARHRDEGGGGRGGMLKRPSDNFSDAVNHRD